MSTDSTPEAIEAYLGATAEDLVHAAAPDLPAAFPGLAVDVIRVARAADRLLIRVRLRGVHTGVYLGIGPTGRAVDVPAGVEVERRAGGAAHPRLDLDRLEILAQLGAVNLPAARRHAD